MNGPLCGRRVRTSHGWNRGLIARPRVLQISPCSCVQPWAPPLFLLLCLFAFWFSSVAEHYGNSLHTCVRSGCGGPPCFPPPIPPHPHLPFFASPPSRNRRKLGALGAPPLGVSRVCPSALSAENSNNGMQGPLPVSGRSRFSTYVWVPRFFAVAARAAPWLASKPWWFPRSEGEPGFRAARAPNRPEGVVPHQWWRQHSSFPLPQ